MNYHFSAIVTRTAAPAALLVPGVTSAESDIAQQQGHAWPYGLSLFSFLPSLSGSASTPMSQGGPSIDVHGGDRILAGTSRETWMASQWPLARASPAKAKLDGTPLWAPRDALCWTAHAAGAFLYYRYVGTGQSKLTWQAPLGLSYAFSEGKIKGMLRCISYDPKSDSAIEELKFNGPMIGATIRW